MVTPLTLVKSVHVSNIFYCTENCNGVDELFHSFFNTLIVSHIIDEILLKQDAYSIKQELKPSGRPIHSWS